MSESVNSLRSSVSHTSRKNRTQNPAQAGTPLFPPKEVAAVSVAFVLDPKRNKRKKKKTVIKEWNTTERRKKKAKKKTTIKVASCGLRKRSSFRGRRSRGPNRSRQGSIDGILKPAKGKKTLKPKETKRAVDRDHISDQQKGRLKE